MTDDKLDNNDTQEYTEEAQRHAQKIAENYRKLLDKATAPDRFEAEEPKNTYAAPVYSEPAGFVREAEPIARPEPVTENYLTADNAARISDYTAHPAPKTKKVLFEGVTYTKGGYIHGPTDSAVYSEPAVREETVQAPVMEAPVMEVPVMQEVAAPTFEAQPQMLDGAEDDSLPTPRTMLHRTVAEEAQEEGLRVGFWSVLSAKMRIALAAVTTAIFIAVTLICINTAILDNINADIAGKQMRLTELRQSAEELQEQIDTTTEPGNVDQWAMDHGMVR